MNKYIYDKSNCLLYEPKGNYYLAYLADIDKQTPERFERLIENMKRTQDIPEQPKVENALKLVQLINNLRACAMEIVEREIIYV